MNKEYPEGTHWMIAGDTNDLKLDAILHMTPQMKQVVRSPTRLNPPRILDPIITTLSTFYQTPVCQKPLDAYAGTGGAPSDHLCVKFSPVTSVNNLPARQKRKVLIRLMPESNYLKFEEWLKKQDWKVVTSVETAHKQAERLQTTLLEAIEKKFHKK